MVGVKLEGRLGNQMFQFAFAYATAKKLDTKFYLDRSIIAFLPAKYFDLPKNLDTKLDYSIFKIKGYKHFFSHHLKKAFYLFIKCFYRLQTIVIANENVPTEEIKKIEPNTLIIGYFQSELYFLEARAAIKSFFSIKKPFRESFQQQLSNLPKDKPYIAVHIRRGDYRDLGLDLPYAYFHEAIEKIGDRDAFYVFLSDEPDQIENEFSYLPYKYISKQNEIIDFQFLTQANTCVLSNSSFSWWGAYLNSKQATIYAPKNWLGKESELPRAVIQKNWTKL